MKPFCNFCKCSDCINGSKFLRHAQTTKNKWICDVCYHYDVCIDAKRKEGKREGPCDDKNCVHRPKLKSGWEKMK